MARPRRFSVEQRGDAMPDQHRRPDPHRVKAPVPRPVVHG
ncbi:hypothetical protein [Azospirillum argentinense]